MRRATRVTALFVDIGGVLLTNGWDHPARKLAAQTFGLALDEMEERHHLTFDTYELGKLTLDDYLDYTVFYRKRPFSPTQFRRFMFAQSKPFPEMIELVRRLRARYGLKVLAVSNEGRELTAHRVGAFELGEFVDGFVASCFVRLRKPDPEIYRLALDIAQVPARHVAYLEDRRLFARVAKDLGLRSIHHAGYASTCTKLASVGLDVEA